VIGVLCGIKISAVYHLVLSQYTHLTDGQTDRIATAIPFVKCITCRTVKMKYFGYITRHNSLGKDTMLGFIAWPSQKEAREGSGLTTSASGEE